MVLKPEQLSAELTRFCDLRHRLIEAGAAADEPLLMEALRAVCGLHDAIAGAVRSALEDENTASRLRGRMDEMEARLGRLAREAERKRDMALKAMAEAGLEHIHTNDLRICVRRAPPALIISDESMLPDTFKVARPSWFDYQAIRDALRSGAHVPGAALGEAEPYLSVRTG